MFEKYLFRTWKNNLIIKEYELQMLAVQNVLFNFQSLPSHLFYQSYGESYFINDEDNILSVESFDGEASLNFLGIFNSFPAEHFFLNTSAKEVFLKIKYDGNIDILKVFQKTEWSDNIVLVKRNLDQKEIVFGPFELSAGIKRYSFSLHTRSKFLLESAQWLVSCDDIVEKSVDISITTFKKEKYVIKNVNNLLNYKPLMNKKYRILVVDNASTLSNNDFIKSDKLELISQANLGGTGGFMRGLVESHTKGTDYILFMDDDILLVPEIVFRAISIAQIAKENIALGGMMLHLTKKDKIHEQGGRLPWKVSNFFKAINDGDYLLEPNNNKLYDKLYSEGFPDFSGWWFYMAEVKQTPFLPNFFFKWDDICSSLYLQKKGIRLSVFPSIFVWHEDFDIKRHLFMTDYLSMRNEIFTFAFLDIPMEQMKVSFRRTAALIIRDILLWDYSRAEIRLKALSDVLQYQEILSLDFIKKGNYNYPVLLGKEYTPKMENIPNNVDIYFEKENTFLPRKFTNRRIIRLILSVIKLIYPNKKKTLKNGKYPLLSMNNGNYSIVYSFKKYFLYNSDGKIGYFCEYSFIKMCNLLIRLFVLIYKNKRSYPKIVKYMKSENFNMEYWKRIFNITETNKKENM